MEEFVNSGDYDNFTRAVVNAIRMARNRGEKVARLNAMRTFIECNIRYFSKPLNDWEMGERRD